MGGAKNQKLTSMKTSNHQQLHRDLNGHLSGYTNSAGLSMRPSSINSGPKIQGNFSRTERLGAMADFYKGKGRKYKSAANDFFTQHPGLK